MARAKSRRLTDAEVRAHLIARGYTFRPTTDDWSPAFPDGTVAISPGMALSDGRFRVAVWGADDLGMEKDVASAPEADRLLASLPAVITMADLRARGFGPT